MQYFILHPVLTNSFSDSNELLRRFMCIGDSFPAVLELGAVKLKSDESDEDGESLAELVLSVEVVSVSREHNAVMEKIVRRFGWDLEPKVKEDASAASMVACLLKAERFDVLEQIVEGRVASVSELSTVIC